MRFFLLFLVVAVAVARAGVLSLTPEDFDAHVGGSKAVMCKFFAPWCGHCKALAPAYEKLAEQFAGSSKVEIAEVDCDAHSELCGRFGVQGYPTIKYFAKGSTTGEDYEGGRTVEELAKYIEEHGARRTGARSSVVALHSGNFDKVVLDADKSALVKFYAPWCGHCKALAPAYEKVAAAYANEEDVVIAEVNCDVEKDLCGRFDVTGFPTLKFFGKANKEGVSYEGGRDVEDFVQYLNSNLNLHRTSSGRLSDKAGRSDALDAIAAKFLAAENKAELVKEAKQLVDELHGAAHKQAKFYVKAMESVIEKGADFIANEKARLQRVLESGSLKAKKVDEFSLRLNILGAF